MTSNLPGSEVLDIRDYLYVDRERVGSLLAQFVGGLAEERSEEHSRSRRVGIGIKRVAEMSRDSGEKGGQKLALADLHVSQLEENAIALGMLDDHSEKMSRRKFWLRGKVRSLVRPGMLLRVTAPTQISDVSSITAAFRQLGTVMDDADGSVLQFIGMIEALYGESITVSVRTAGVDDFEVGFVGEIPHRHEFGPMQRELLLSQVGAAAGELTVLMQIAAVPTEQDSDIPLERRFGDLAPMVQRLTAGAGLNRSILDQLLSVLGGALTATGLVAAPHWPAVGMVPLAIYRTVEHLPDLEDHLPADEE